jgi:hypothetical protein
MLRRKSVVTVFAAIGSLLLVPVSAASLSTIEGTAEIRIVGEALETALPRVGKAYQVRIGATRELRSQRVTVFIRKGRLEEFARGIDELLTATPDASVSWIGDGDRSWSLTESLNRQRLKRQLADIDIALFKRQLVSEIEWLRQSAERDLTAASKDPNPRRRMIVQERLTLASILDAIGERGQTQLLAGVPLSLVVGEADPKLRSLLRESLVSRSPNLATLPPDELDRYSLVFVAARNPSDSQGMTLIESRVTPQGFVWSRRGTSLKIPHVLNVPFLHDTFRLDQADPSDLSRRISLNLVPEPQIKPGTTVLRNLDQVLEVLSREAALNIVADGYLRAPAKFPANLEVKDYPLKQLLDRLGQIWGIKWKYANKQQATLIIRARDWWLEDQADIPQPLLDELRHALGPGRSPRLEDLLRIAELSKPQLHRLVESGICPGAYGVVKPLWYDDLGTRRCLQFFSRLAPALRNRAQSMEGLPLREVPPDLVERWLSHTLVAEVGALTPQQRQELVFWLTSGAQNPQAKTGYTVTIRSLKQGGSHWREYIQPPSAPVVPKSQ